MYLGNESGGCYDGFHLQSEQNAERDTAAHCRCQPDHHLSFYDASGRLEYIRDEEDYPIVHYVYDELSRTAQVNYYRGQSFVGSMTYDFEDNTGDDDLGNRIEKIDYDTGSGGNYDHHLISYTYDSVGNVTSTDVGGASGDYGWSYYDALSRLISYDYIVNYAANTDEHLDVQRVDYTYHNDTGQKKSIVAYTATANSSDPLDFTNVTFTEVYNAEYEFDALDRLTDVLAEGSQLADMGYDENGNRDSLTYDLGSSKSVSLDYTYNIHNFLTDIDTTRTGTANTPNFSFDASTAGDIDGLGCTC